MENRGQGILAEGGPERAGITRAWWRLKKPIRYGVVNLLEGRMLAKLT